MTPFYLCAPEGIAAIADWLAPIPWTDWPQQSRLDPARIRPAFVTDLSWHGFGERTDELVKRLAHVAAAYVAKSSTVYATRNRWLSVVMPGAGIDAHRDEQPGDFIARVHVPIVSDVRAWFFTGEGEDRRRDNLRVGCAYLVDPRVVHEIRNDGDTPRVHLMFDVVEVRS